MDRIREAISAMPLREDAVQRAFEHFGATGELPENQRLAGAVTRQALHGGKPVEHVSAWLLVWEGIEHPTTTNTGEEVSSARKYLFDEAVHGTGLVRHGARVALQALVQSGGRDVTDPAFLADMALPEHEGLGLDLIGFPERLAAPPFVHQAQRLFDRYAELRSRIALQGPEWFDRLEAALLEFHEYAELPSDDLLRDAVLADFEMKALLEHAVGVDVRERMRLLDGAARLRGDARETAILHVQAYQHAQLRPGSR